MDKPDTIRSIYFIGIGGIGMSALARYFLFRGKTVSGYDRTPTELTRQLEAEGISVSYTDDPDAAPEADLVVYTPAIPADNSLLAFYRRKHSMVVKRSEVLGAITERSFNICVAGTHGKTTISTMVAHILRHSGYGCNAFLGGIAVNYNSNFWSSERNTCVVEADEYDRSFLRLNPDIAVITAMDADHLDIYGTPEAMRDAFIEFSGRVKEGGVLYVKKELAATAAFLANQVLTYSIDDTGADVYARNIRPGKGGYGFDVVGSESTFTGITLNMGGLHNVENAVASIAVAGRLGIGESAIRSAVESFRGVKRRFEYIARKEGLVYIDDYAHHPAELSALIRGARALFGDMKCTVIFQPHLFTRTRDLADEFARSLDLADEVVLLPIYPARELPIEGVSAQTIAERMHAPVKVMEKAELEEYLRKHFMQGGGDRLLITAGAGDIDRLVEPVKQIVNAA